MTFDMVTDGENPVLTFTNPTPFDMLRDKSDTIRWWRDLISENSNGTNQLDTKWAESFDIIRQLAQTRVDVLNMHAKCQMRETRFLAARNLCFLLDDIKYLKIEFLPPGRKPIPVPIDYLHSLVASAHSGVQVIAETWLGPFCIRDGLVVLDSWNDKIRVTLEPHPPAGPLSMLALVIKNYVHGRYPDAFIHDIAQQVLGRDFYQPVRRSDEETEEREAKRQRIDDIV